MIVYKVTNLINNKIYIGKTTSTLERRKIQHRSDAKKRLYKCVLHDAINKYGESNFSWEIVDRCLFSESLLELEKYYIRKFHSKIPNGYNMTDGGEGATGRILSDESRRKMSRAQLGRRHSKECKRKMSLAHRGEKNHFYGKRHTAETKLKMSQRHWDCSGERNPMSQASIAAREMIGANVRDHAEGGQ